MKLLLVFLVSLFVPKTEIKEVSYSYSSYIVYDGIMNDVLEGHDINLERSVASISKIMTAIISIEYGFLDDYLIIGDWINRVDGSSVYLYVGEVVKVEELLYGLMLRSGNDCAVSLAMHVSGNIPSFVDLMNVKAKEIGMNNSVFRNPSGLDADDGGNISSAYDMALLTSYAMKNKLFREVVSSQSYKSTNHGVWKNKNRLLDMYKYAIGGKTGYTKLAKRTLVSVSKKEDTELIVITLNCGNDFSFHKQLYEKWFDRYRVYKVIEKGKWYINEYIIYCDSDLYTSFNENEKMIVNYRIEPSKGVMEIVGGIESKNVGTCQIKGKIDKDNDNNKRKSIFERIIDWFKG